MAKKDVVPQSVFGLVIWISQTRTAFVKLLSPHAATESVLNDKLAKKFMKMSIELGWLPAYAKLIHKMPLTPVAEQRSIALEDVITTVQSYALKGYKASELNQCLQFSLHYEELIDKVTDFVAPRLTYHHLMAYSDAEIDAIDMVRVKEQTAYITPFI
jgi:hypothetical protein